MSDNFVLYGTMLSPFVRRVAVWLELQGAGYEVEDPKVFAEGFETIQTMNPLSRIPALVIDDGPALIEAWAITDALEDRAPADKKLIPASGAARRTVMQQVALGNAVAEKAVALVYERIRRPAEWQWPEWGTRLETQVGNGLDALEAGTPDSGWYGGAQPNGADVAAVCAYDFVLVRLPELAGDRPKLAALSQRANELAPFARTYP